MSVDANPDRVLGHGSPTFDRPGPGANIAAMDDELDALAHRIARITALAQQLSDENRALRERLEAAQQDNAMLQQRMAEARGRVESALARLPELAGEPIEPVLNEH